MLQEFDLDIKDKKKVKNVVVDHQSRLDNATMTQKKKNILEEFPYKNLLAISERPWFADMASYKAIKIVSEEYTWPKKEWFY